MTGHGALAPCPLSSRGEPSRQSPARSRLAEFSAAARCTRCSNHAAGLALCSERSLLRSHKHKPPAANVHDACQHRCQADPYGQIEYQQHRQKTDERENRQHPGQAIEQHDIARILCLGIRGPITSRSLPAQHPDIRDEIHNRLNQPADQARHAESLVALMNRRMFTAANAPVKRGSPGLKYIPQKRNRRLDPTPR